MTDQNQFGRSPYREFPGAVNLVGLQAALWAAVFLILLLVVPRYLHAFADLDVELPAVSLVVVQVSSVVVSYWYAFLFYGFIGLALDLGVLLVLSRKSRRIIGVLLCLVPILLGAFVLLGVFLPMMTLPVGD